MLKLRNICLCLGVFFGMFVMFVILNFYVSLWFVNIYYCVWFLGEGNMVEGEGFGEFFFFDILKLI